MRLGTKPGHGIVCILSTVWIDFLCSRDAAREEGFLRKLLGMTGPMRLSEMPAFAILPFNFGGVHWVLGVYSFEERELHLGEGLHGKRILSIDRLLTTSIIASKMDRFHSIVFIKVLESFPRQKDSFNCDCRSKCCLFCNPQDG